MISNAAYETFKDRVADNDTAGAVEIVGEVVFEIHAMLQRLDLDKQMATDNNGE